MMRGESLNHTACDWLSEVSKANHRDHGRKRESTKGPWSGRQKRRGFWATALLVRLLVLAELGDALGAELEVPGASGLEGLIDVVDVLDAGGLEPVAEGLFTLLGEDGDAVFPGGAAAEDTVEFGAGLAGEFKGLDEDGVGDAGREIDERLVGHAFGVAEVLQSLGASVGLLALESFGAFDELHDNGDLDLEDIDVVARLAELRHGAGDDLRLLLGVGEGLLVAAIGIVANELKEEGDVVGKALVADALDPGLHEVVDVGLLEGGVVEEDLDAIGSGFLQAADGPDVEQIGQATGGVGVVAGLLVREEEAFAVAVFRCGQAVLWVEQNGGGVLAEDVGDQCLEDFEVMAGGFGSALFGEGLLERSALIHSGSGDNAARVGDRF